MRVSSRTQIIFLAGATLDIHRQVHDHRPLPAGTRQEKCGIHHIWQIANIRDQEGRLGDWLHQVNRVHLLKPPLLDRQVAAHIARADLAGDHHQRDIVEIGIGDRRHRICDAGTRRHHEDGRRPGDARISQRGIAGALFVAGADNLDLRAVLDTVQDRTNGAARKDKDMFDAISQKRIQHDVGAQDRPGFFYRRHDAAQERDIGKHRLVPSESFGPVNAERLFFGPVFLR